jgi:TrmH family RNA methyltransferase
MEVITSLQNPRIKDAVKLRDRRQRVRQRRIIIDGAREIRLAQRSGVKLVEVYVCEPLCHTADARAALTELSAARAPLVGVSESVFAKLAFGERAEGLVAIAETPRSSLSELSLPSDALIAVLEGVEKPGNVGAVLRSADAAGVAAVIVADGGTDLFNPNCIRASLGAIFTLSVCAATTAETLPWLAAGDWQVAAARVDGAVDYTKLDYRRRTAIVLGSEADGLSAAWNGPQVMAIRLPMRGMTDSLNVSATAAVLFYEALRQRG